MCIDIDALTWDNLVRINLIILLVIFVAHLNETMPHEELVIEVLSSQSLFSPVCDCLLLNA